MLMKIFYIIFKGNSVPPKTPRRAEVEAEKIKVEMRAMSDTVNAQLKQVNRVLEASIAKDVFRATHGKMYVKH